MQSAEHAPARPGMIVLDESSGQSELGELVCAKNLNEKPALVFKNVRVAENHQAVQMLTFYLDSHGNRHYNIATKG